MNLPSYNGDLSKYLGRSLSMGDSQAINNAFGYDNARANYDFVSGGNVYRLENNNNNTRTVRQVDSVANRMAEKAKADRLAAIAPAIKSLEDTKPEITQLYGTERTRLESNKQPLQERYKSLLDQIKGKETVATNRQTLTTNNEMAKRGLSNDSGVYQQEMTNALNPITTEYAGLIKDTSLAQEEGLKGIDDAIAALLPQQTSDLRSISQKIADIQAGAGNQSVDDYLGLARMGLENSWKEREFNESVRQFGINEALQRLQLEGSGGNQNQYATLSEGQTLYDLLNGRSVFTAPKSYKQTASAAGGGWF